MRKRGPGCSICAHPQLAEIDADSRAQNKVAKKFGVAPSSLQRHRAHLKEDAPPKPPRVVQTPAAPVAPPQAPAADSQLDPRVVAVETLRALRYSLTVAAPEDVPTVANAITSATRLLAHLTGSLQVTQANIVRSAAWVRILRCFETTFEKHPEARLALAEFAKEMAELGE